MSGLTITVESGITLKTKHEHYIRETRAMTVDYDAFRKASGLDPDHEVTNDRMRQSYIEVADLLRDTIWDAVEAQLEILED